MIFRILTTLIAFTTTFSVVLASFPDVPESHANFEAITFLYERGVINGYDNGNYGPDDPVTRVQALKILLLGSKIDAPEGVASSFPDVPSTHWGQRFIAAAADRSIVNGNADGTFRADRTLNLAEALKMLLKTNDITPARPTSAPFGDVAVSDWYAPFATYAKTKQLVDPVSELRAGNDLTRGGLAELMYRLMYINENELDSFQITNERQIRIRKAYDGDTLTSSTGEKIRVIGINAPEKGEDFAQDATDLTRSLALNQQVTIRICDSKRDRYGRTLAEVFTSTGKSVAEELISAGLAITYFPSSCGRELKTSYESLEAKAKLLQLGIWQDYTEPVTDTSNSISTSTSTYQCDTKTYCTDMETCEEAEYFLNTCGLDRLDADDDGIPCESLCGDS